MEWVFLLALQAAAPGAPLLQDIEFDLATVRSVPTLGGPFTACVFDSAADILVCGRRGGGGGDYPMEEWERIFRQRPLKAEVGLGGGSKARAFTQSATLGNGMISSRAMVGVKIPF